MKKYFILPLLLVLAVGLSAPLAFAQTTGSVKGVLQRRRREADRRGRSGVVWDRHRPQVHPQNQQQGRVFLARHRPRQVQRQAVARTARNSSLQRRPVGGRNDAGLRPEERTGGRSPRPGNDSEQAAKVKEAAAKAEPKRRRRHAQRKTQRRQDGFRCRRLREPQSPL
jgi:hypothetical protein